MTRCAEFYEKLEKDGNFCGMREQEYREAVRYSKEVVLDKNGNPLLSEDAWRKQQRELKATKDTEEQTKLRNRKTLNAADFATQAELFWTWARKYRTEEQIEEVLDKARVNTR